MKVYTYFNGEINMMFKTKREALADRQEYIDNGDSEKEDMPITVREMTKEEWENLPESDY